MNVPEQDESQRLDALRAYAILDTAHEAEFDRLVRLAARVCRAPIATITLVDSGRQWFKASVGLELRQTDRAIAFCNHAIRQRGTFVVRDASADPLFSSNPLVTGAPGIRFYAGVPLVNPDGFALGALAVIDLEPRDLSAEEEDSLRILAEQTVVLLESRRLAGRLTRTLESLSDAFFTLDRTWRFTFLNREAESLLERKREDLLGKDIWTAFPALRGSPFERNYRRAMSESMSISFEEHYAPLDRWFLVTVHPSPEGLAVHFQDSSAPRAIAEALRRSESRFRAVALATNDAIWEWDMRAGRVWRNEAFARAFEEPQSEDVADVDSLLARVHPDDRDRIVQTFQEACAGRQTSWRHEYRLLKPKGSVLHVTERGFVVFDSQDRPCQLVGGITDVTERRKSAERLAQQAALLDKAQDAIIVRDLDHRIRFWNRSAERIYGWGADEVLGTRIDALIYEDTAPFERATALLFENGEWAGELAQRRRDGTLLTVEGRWTLIRDARGRPASVLAINTDISDRRALQDRLRQSQRLEAIGQLTGGIAHDFNNLLTVILGNSELLAEQLGESDPESSLAALADMSRMAAQRGAELTQRLLAFARRQALQPRPVRLGEVIASMKGLLLRTLPEHIRIEQIDGSGPANAYVDPAQLESALLNLCLNARDAMPQGGRLAIETATERIGPEDAQRHPGLAPGDYVIVAISDTGHGIPARDLHRVFEPFFTTKEPGKGTGLGLSMVYGFARQSGGLVTVESEVGRGTTVRLYLPPAAPEVAAFSHRPRPASESAGGETVLVVEDDELVRRHAERLLTTLGYRVVGASDASQALAILRSGTQIDLLFTDVVMPGGMDGRQLAEAAAGLRPGLKVLYTSGYDDNVLVRNGSLEPGLHLLGKPYRRQELARSVRAVLDGTPASTAPGAQVRAGLHAIAT